MERRSALLEHDPVGWSLDNAAVDVDYAFQKIAENEAFENDLNLVYREKPLKLPSEHHEDVSYNDKRDNAESLSDADRLLTEVDHFVRDLRQYGRILPETRAAVRQNLATAIQEQAMPYAVTETRHEAVYDPERKERIFMWMGKTAVENAMSGYLYHRHESALRRVDVEVDEARHSSSMEFGKARVFISPRMTEKDAPENIAKDEHLFIDDAVRVSWLKAEGEKVERVMRSLLVKDIPFEAWVAMLEDPRSIFGKSIKLNVRDSALSVMKAHHELELPLEALPHGPVTIIEAVVPYIEDVKLRSRVENSIGKYYQDQNELAMQAELKAAEWEKFEAELAVSLDNTEATEAVARFIRDLTDVWSDTDKAIIDKHTHPETIWMTRELAAVLESAMQLLLSARTAVLADGEHVLGQVKNIELFKTMQEAERRILYAQQSGLPIEYMLSLQNVAMARHDIRPNGGGCPGENLTRFKSATANDLASPNSSLGSNDELSESNASEACQYSGTFCYCCPYNDDGSKAPKPITVTAYRDERGVATCQRSGCGATMKGNKVTYKGAIWERAQMKTNASDTQKRSTFVGFAALKNA